MRKDELSLLDGYVAGSKESMSRDHHLRAQPEISSIVWSRLVKGEMLVRQPWHQRLQYRRYHE
ncbi:MULTISPECIES: hypothetical protein [Paenibacillus]|uniref:Uncharacterized protein n=1 Tax=Paenibacillus lactis TaxID=228574 RepID=A0ABS4FK37_9BACL|nr:MULTISPECIES: hypothetical protein [Paenibacillus]MBP1896603.1 hypothetical protein [Paenibacillus lactis]MCM3496711.1 hypothetical protein [Paenibacillus lactis]GIO94623.1 hypothetical protein J31TS3_58500 [Paenibacillus lactis]HAG00319.1 hypothetical protein [Paenibacillus lactis]